MSVWIQNNIGTICVTAILLAVVALIIVKLVRDRKKGSSLCGCNCAHCGMAGKCHKTENG